MIPDPCRIVQLFSVLAHIIPGNLSIHVEKLMFFQHSA